MKEYFVLGAVVGLYTFVRDWVKVQNMTLYKYPWILDAGAFAAGYFLRKSVPAVSNALIVGAVGNGVKDAILAAIRLSSKTSQTDQIHQ